MINALLQILGYIALVFAIVLALALLETFLIGVLRIDEKIKKLIRRSK